jgi:hypothetical protein
LTALLAGQALPGRITVFLPSHAQGQLVRDGTIVDLVSGASVDEAEGQWSLLVTVEGYEPYRQVLVVHPGGDVIVVPRLIASAETRAALGRIQTARKSQEAEARNRFFLAAAATGVGALAGWVFVGVLEGILASQKSELSTRQAAYRAASGADAPTFWMAVETQESSIETSRTWEAGALATATGLSAGAFGLWFLGEALP